MTVTFNWFCDFALRGIHLGVSYCWVTDLLSGRSNRVSIGFIIGLLEIKW